MINPYAPPENEIPRGPFWVRFARAVRRAYRAYQAGMREDGMTAMQQVWAWCGLLVLLLFLLLALAIFATGVLVALRLIGLA